MRAMLWFRITAVVMLLFGALHTFGFLTFRPPAGEGMAVWNRMNDVSFTVDGGTYSFGHFYRAFGLSITAAQLFGAWVMWTLGSMARRGDGGVKAIALGVIVWQVIGAVIAVRYVSAEPATLSAVTVVCIVIALAARKKESSHASRRELPRPQTTGLPSA
jgi:hypothetical protein